MAGKSLVRQFEIKQRKSKILELLSDEDTGYTYKQVAEKVGVSLQFVTETVKESLMSATTPEKILELREDQAQTIQSHTPRLHKRFLTQSNLTTRLADKYETLLDEEEKGMYSYPYLFEMFKDEVILNWDTNHFDEELNMAIVEKDARELAREEIAQYRSKREAIAREMERTTKLGNENFQVLLKQQERLAKLYGLDTPVTSTLMIHRSDEIKISLEEDIKATQKEIEAQQPVIQDAEIVEEEEINVENN